MNSKAQINISVIGAGYLGEYHIQQLKNIDNINIIGFYDIDNKRVKYIINKYQIKFQSIQYLLDKSNAICIVTPTNTHFNIAKRAIKKNCHVFIEKPITETIEQSTALIKLAQEKNRYIQVGHVERFNPAYQFVAKQNFNARFIECHRLSKLNNRALDVSVILDLMIHDIDLICNLKNNKIINVESNGVSVISDSIDIANARITFSDGCVANLTSSRISQKNMRKMRIFTKGKYYNIDLLNKKADMFSIDSITKKPQKDCTMQLKTKKNNNALYDELNNFIHSIDNKTTPRIDGKSGKLALEIALQIQNKING